MLDLAGSTYLQLNRTAALLWRQLAEAASREDLVSELTSEYDVDAEQTGQDVDRFLGQLEAKLFLDRSD